MCMAWECNKETCLEFLSIYPNFTVCERMQQDAKPAIDAFKMGFVDFDIIVYPIQYICCNTMFLNSRTIICSALLNP